MPKRSYDTRCVKHTQEEHLADEPWEQEVVPRLPAKLETQARSLKAFERVKKVRSAKDLLRALLAYVLVVGSFRRLGMWAVLIGLADLSEKAWRKRLRKARRWLEWLLGELLTAPAPVKWLAERTSGRVLLIDATRLKQPAGTGDDWRLHTAYDLLQGRLAEVTVTDQHGGESLSHFQLRKGDHTVCDNGYGYRRSVATTHAAGATLTARITPSSFPLEDEQGQPIDLVALLRKKGPVLREIRCWCGWEGQRYRVRIIARKYPPHLAKLLRERKEQQKKRKGKAKTMKAETLFLAGWIILVTTLPEAEWPAEDVLRLYRARWQIELLFKRLKQLLRLHEVKSKHVETVQATLCLVLIAWALQEDQARHIRGVLQDVVRAACVPERWGEALAVSSWSLNGLCLDLLRQQLQGHWSAARLEQCLPKLQRFLIGSPRRRLHHESTLRLWLTSRLVTGEVACAC